MKIIFFGNTKYSKIGLEIINKTFPISAVVTIPDRIDKNKNPIINPVKEFALSEGIPVLEFEKLNNESFQKINQFESDFFIVEDYGLIIPSSILKIPKILPLNIHHSLLPKYRGPSPVPSAILAGDDKTGVTVIKVEENVDSGDILAQEEYLMTGEETTDLLLKELNIKGANLLVSILDDLVQGKIKSTPQDESKVTSTRKFTKEDGFFEIDNPPVAEKLNKMIRAFYPWPGAWTKWNGKIVKFLPEGNVQMEGKKATDFKSFLNGYPDFPLKIP